LWSSIGLVILDESEFAILAEYDDDMAVIRDESRPRKNWPSGIYYLSLMPPTNNSVR
jgi:hypothetical protein